MVTTGRFSLCKLSEIRLDTNDGEQEILCVLEHILTHYLFRGKNGSFSQILSQK